MTELRKDLENRTYLAYKGAEGLDKERLELELRTLLLNHAQAVMYGVLRRTDPALLHEAADKVMMMLPRFEGHCLFTTWAHKVLMHEMYQQRRLDRKRREVSMETTHAFDLPGEPSNELTDILLTIDKILDEDEKQVFDQMYLQGKTTDETGVTLGLHASSVQRRWSSVRRKLQHEFAK